MWKDYRRFPFILFLMKIRNKAIEKTSGYSTYLIFLSFIHLFSNFSLLPLVYGTLHFFNLLFIYFNISNLSHILLIRSHFRYTRRDWYLCSGFIYVCFTALYILVLLSSFILSFLLIAPYNLPATCVAFIRLLIFILQMPIAPSRSLVELPNRW